MKSFVALGLFLVSFAPVDLAPVAKETQSKSADESGDLEGSESLQSFGYGYGTKVADKYGGVSTVYVHGFGTDNTDYHDTPVYHDKSYKAPDHVYGHHLKSYEHHSKPYYAAPTPYYKPSGYGYGHINEYGEAKHGYGYQNGYGYHGSTTSHYGNYGKSAHSPYYAATPYGGKYAAPSYHAPLYGHHAQARAGFTSGFGYGFIA